jgi:hypothetical protein
MSAEERRGACVLLAGLADWDPALTQERGARSRQRMDEPSRVRFVDRRGAGVRVRESGADPKADPQSASSCELHAAAQKR